MQFHRTTQSKAHVASAQVDAGLRAHMLKVYSYMAGALGITGITAFVVASSPAMINFLFFSSPITKWIVMLAPLGIVFFLSARIFKMSLAAAQSWFWVYAAVMGLSLSTVLLAFTGESVARVFFVTAASFGALSLYGYTTKRDLSGMGSFLFMGLIGIILASVVNIFLESSGLQWAISVLGVLIFAGLTAHDTQKTKQIYYQLSSHGEALGKAAIMGALSLYLDFINLMMFLLQFLGDRR